MRNQLEYPLTIDEVIDFFEKEKARIDHEIDENMICGDMRPQYFGEALRLLYKENAGATDNTLREGKIGLII